MDDARAPETGMTEAERAAIKKAARTTPPMTLMDTEPPLVDFARMHLRRIARLRAEIARADVAGVVLIDLTYQRYATGIRDFALFQAHFPCSFVFVPATGPVVYSGTPSGRRMADRLAGIDETIPGLPVHPFLVGDDTSRHVGAWAAKLAELAQRESGTRPRIACDPVAPEQWQALTAAGLEVVQAAPLVEHARSIKGPDEIMAMNHAIAVVEGAMAEMRTALRPGMTETEFWSILHKVNIANGGDWAECRLVSSGDRANPWETECSNRVIRAGDLVAFDTDLVGPNGFFVDISRTYHAGPGRPTDHQRDLYKHAVEEIAHNMALIKPGMSFKEISDKAWKIPDRFVANRYDILAHGVGVADEWPGIAYPQDWDRVGYDGHVAEGMVLCLESCIGEEGGADLVKLEQMALLTDEGLIQLSRYPYEDTLLN